MWFGRTAVNVMTHNASIQLIAPEYLQNLSDEISTTLQEMHCFRGYDTEYKVTAIVQIWLDKKMSVFFL